MVGIRIQTSTNETTEKELHHGNQEDRKERETFSLFEGPMGFQVMCLEHDRRIAMIYAVPEVLVVGDKESGSKVYAKIQPKKVDWLGFPDWNKMELCDFESSTTRGNYSPEEFFKMAVDELTSI